MTIRDTIHPIGSPAAPTAAAGERAAAPRRAWRATLAVKLAAALVGLVVLVLLVNGAINTWLGYDKAKSAALEVQAEKARSAAVRVGEFLAEIETQLGWTTGAEWRFAKPDQQRYDFVRLLRQVPAITELSYLDGQGAEQLRVSRLEPDSVGSAKDFSNDPRFVRAVADKIWFGPVEFRRGSEPYMTIALAHVGRKPGVTVADVNLKLIWDVITAIRVGEQGYAFVVDEKGRLIAHPDLSLVLRETDFSKLPQVSKALADSAPSEPRASAMAGPRVGMAEFATGLDGGGVLTAYAVAPRAHWIVFVQQPLAEALASVYKSLLQTLALLGLGLALALIVGGLLARRMVVPIRRLQQGAERLGAGDLAQRLDIRTGDEIEALAGGFNRMAGQLQQSYENLEAKVEARTRDLNEALERQTATADVLKAISRSAFDVDSVLDTLVHSAARLSGADEGVISVREGDVFRVRAATWTGEIRRRSLGSEVPSGPHTVSGLVGLSQRVVEIEDIRAIPDFPFPLDGLPCRLGVPMLRQDELVGVLVLMRREIGRFSPRAIELVQTFADQAVIAIENARLFEEVQARTRDLEESLARQTATADVLKIISRSIDDAAPVFETILESCQRLFDPHGSAIYLVEGDRVEGVAKRGFEGQGQWGADRMPLAGSSTGRAIAERRAVHFPDLAEKPDLPEQAKVVLRQTGGMTVLYAPMLSSERGVGSLVVTRRPNKPFTEAEIDFIQTFADQAVIAIENARLFAEVQAKTRDLEESLAQQMATADVLKAISRSVFDLDSVLRTLIDTAVRLCRGSRGTIFIRNGDRVEARAFHSNVPAGLRDFLLENPIPHDDEGFIATSIREGRKVHHADLVTNRALVPERARAEAAFGAVLCVPLMREGEAIGCFAVPREAPQAFSTREIELVETFADQAVIAIENARLFGEVQSRTRELEQSLSDLRKAQDRLVQSEKLASLGQLTAGIAHEIKNPLNFVNNFSALSRELLEELREALKNAPFEPGQREEADELIGMVDSNLAKVVSHGRRADSIVKNMLLHSREGSGERASVDVNAMVEEALNLAYHGARAEKPGFKVTIAKSLDPAVGSVDLYPQEMTRVLLNLISNGFYATAKRGPSESGAGYEPTITATTRDLGDHVSIAIRDNGTGIPDAVKAKIFNPFFTTKPAGEGTGLGLSLSYDIVVKQHGGTLEVSTEPGAFTEFAIVLPRTPESAGAGEPTGPRARALAWDVT